MLTRFGVRLLVLLSPALLAHGAAAASFTISGQSLDAAFTTFGLVSLSADGSRFGYAYSGGTFGADSEGHRGDRVTTPSFSADGTIAMGGYAPQGGAIGLYRRVGATETVLAQNASALGLSDDGQRYVGFQFGSSGVGAFVADYAPGPPVFTPLSDLPGLTASANAISGDGQVIVGRAANSNLTAGEAARWDPTGAVTPLGDLAGGAVNSNARNASYDGRTIVGTGTSAAGTEAVRWVDGVIESLGLGPGSTAYDVSADGSRIVATSNQGVFLLDPYGVHDLELLLANAIVAAGFDPALVSLMTVTAISADGTTVAGAGHLALPMGTSGSVFAWKAVLPVPEPGTALLCASGLLAMAMRRRAGR